MQDDAGRRNGLTHAWTLVIAGSCLALAGWCNGMVTSTGLATWLGGGPPTAVRSNQPTVTLPAGTPSKYANYTITGKDYSAYFLDQVDLKSSDCTTLNAIDMSSSKAQKGVRRRRGGRAATCATRR